MVKVPLPSAHVYTEVIVTSLPTMLSTVSWNVPLRQNGPTVWNVSTGPLGSLKFADSLITNGSTVLADAGVAATKNDTTGTATASANAADRLIGLSLEHAGSGRDRPMTGPF